MAIVEEQFWANNYVGGPVDAFYSQDDARGNKLVSIRIHNQNTRPVNVFAEINNGERIFDVRVEPGQDVSYDVPNKYSNYTPYDAAWGGNEIWE